MTATTYPQHATLKAVRYESAVIAKFIETLGLAGLAGLTICEYHEGFGEFRETMKSTEQLLADFFEVDLKALEAEKRSMIEEIRRVNNC